MNGNLEKLNQENRELIIYNKKLRDAVFYAEVMYYKRKNIEEATKFNVQLKKINVKLTAKLEDIYDI